MASSASDDVYDSDDSCGSSDTGAINDSDTDSGNSSDVDTGTTDRDDQTSDTESDREDGNDEEGSDADNIVWSGVRKNTPIVWFRAECMYSKIRRLYALGEKYHLAYKMVRTECKVVRQILQKHGFRDVHPNSADFNLMWTGSHVKPYTLRTMTEFQKINHFPRSYEITRKDRLYKNFQRMQQSKGIRHFDFLPQTFVTPSEYDDFTTAHMRERGTWIVKPVASSRGRGISLINNPQNVPMDGNHVVSRYISNPLLIDGFKFDCRLYVAVTSFDPLRAYLYEEGLARFATVQYNHTNKTIKNVMMHLTNYSLNKRSNDYVRCNDLNIEDYGNKWSFGAMIRYLQKKGKDVKGMLSRIEDVINKTLLCAELPVATACKMFMPHRGNCFELYGFDILIDENLKPWVLEVNLSPSLACDAPIDLKIKSNMVSDLFNLIGFIAQDPTMRRVSQSKRNQEFAASSALRQQKTRIGSSRQRPHSAGVPIRPASAKKSKDTPAQGDRTLTAEERRVVTESKDEYQRRGGWIRIFPTPTSWDKYKNFFESRTNLNQVLHSRLYPDKRVTGPFLQELANRELDEHLDQFMRKLTTTENITGRKQARNRVRQRYPSVKRMLSAGVMRNAPKSDSQDREPLAQGKLENTKSSNQPPNNKASQSTSQKQSTTSVNLSNSSVGKGTTLQNSSRSGINADGSRSGINANGSRSGINENGSRSVIKADNDRSGVNANGRSGIEPSGKPPIGPSSTNIDTKGARMVLEVQKQPSAKEIRESINVPEIMNSGGDISKLQARLAFSTYLLRVQHRLLAETSKPPDLFEESEQNDEQMDLVLRFLKRAASNLQQPFKVIVPSRKLPAHDRRRILAKQLVDFVEIYNKETEQMDLHMKMDQTQNGSSSDKENNINGDRFGQFTSVATESELEELLTSYTKQNKSASIFLGTNSNKTMSDITAHPVTSDSQPDVTVGHRVGSHGGDVRTKDAGTGAGDASHPSQRRPQSSPNTGLRSTLPSEITAISLYTAHNKSRQRPVSAKTGHHDTGGGQSTSHRPVSAYIRREPPGGEIAARLFSESSQQAIQEALQRLARRQAVRQYSASSTQNQNVVTQQYLQHYNNGGRGGIATSGPLQANLALTSAAKTSRSTSANNLASQSRHRRGYSWDGLKSHSNTSIPSTNVQISRTTSAQASLGQSANSDQLRCQISSQEALDNANSQNEHQEPGEFQWNSTGTLPYNQNARGHAGSQHFQTVLQQNWLRPPSSEGSDEGGRAAQKQPLSLQEKKQISYDMTQQSKAKHQEKVAQAHSSASALREALQRSASSTSNHSTSRSGSHATSHIKPRPPVKSSYARKPVSIQRMARTTQLDDPSSTQTAVRPASASTFYSGLKYNNMTGTTRAPTASVSSDVYNTGFQTAVVRH